MTAKRPAVATAATTGDIVTTPGPAVPEGWAMAQTEMAARGAIDRIAPVHLGQSDAAPRPDDCIYRYEAAEVVVTIGDPEVLGAGTLADEMRRNVAFWEDEIAQRPERADDFARDIIVRVLRLDTARDSRPVGEGLDIERLKKAVWEANTYGLWGEAVDTTDKMARQIAMAYDQAGPAAVRPATEDWPEGSRPDEWNRHVAANGARFDAEDEARRRDEAHALGYLDAPPEAAVRPVEREDDGLIPFDPTEDAESREERRAAIRLGLPGLYVGNSRRGEFSHDLCSEHGPVGEHASIASHLRDVHGIEYDDYRRQVAAAVRPVEREGLPWKSVATSLLSTMKGIARDRTVDTITNARKVAEAAIERAEGAIR